MEVKVRIIKEFREKDNYSILHKVGEVVAVMPDRAQTLIDKGVAEKIEDTLNLEVPKTKTKKK